MFNFAWPWMFLALPLAWAVRRWAPIAKTTTSSALRVPFFASIQSFTATQKHRLAVANVYSLLLYVIWILLVIAAARPQWSGEAIYLPQSGRDIMLAMDISNSMRVEDMGLGTKRTTRLTIVKHAAKKFIKKRENDRLGLILFGSKAYLQTPLTFDHKTIRHMLEDASIGLAGPQTAIGDAIGLAVKRLQNSKAKQRVLILLTDGANNIRIYSIGFGANHMLISGFFNAHVVNPAADLDEDTLKEIAAATGGLFFRATNSLELEKVYRSIDELEPTANKKAAFRPITPLFHWPLAVALLLMAGLMLRKVAPLCLTPRHPD